MSGNIWTPGSPITSTANADNSYKSQQFIATAGQTVFTLTQFVYAVGTGSLLVFLNGVDQYIGTDFVETDSSHVTFTTPLEVGDVVVIRGLIGSTGATAAQTSADAAAASAAASQAAYDAIIALGLPSLPLAVASGGTGSNNKTQGFDNLSPAVTKGDLIVANGTDNVRLGVGSDGQALLADSSQPTGVRWGSAGVGTGAGSASADITLTNASGSLLVVTPTIPGQKVTLPVATTMIKASLSYVITNEGETDLEVADSAGTTIGWIIPKATALIGLFDNTTAAGVWKTNGMNSYGITAQADITFASNPGISGIRTEVLDTDRTALLIFGGNSTWVMVYRKSTNSFGTPVLVRTGNSPDSMVASLLIAADKLLVSSFISTAMETVVITFSGIVATVNTPIATTIGSGINTVNTPYFVVVGTAFVIGYNRGSGSYLNTRVITVAGTVPTVGVETAHAETDVGGSQSSMVVPLTSTTFLVIAMHVANLVITAKPYTVSGTTQTVGTVTTTPVSSSNNTQLYGFSSGRYGLVHTDSSARFCVISVSGTVASINLSATLLSVTLNNGIVSSVLGNNAIIMDVTTGNMQVLQDNAGTAVVGTSVTVAPPSGIWIVGQLSNDGTTLRWYMTATNRHAYAKMTISGTNIVFAVLKALGALTTGNAATLNTNSTNIISYYVAGRPSLGMVKGLKSVATAQGNPQELIMNDGVRSFESSGYRTFATISLNRKADFDVSWITAQVNSSNNTLTFQRLRLA